MNVGSRKKILFSIASAVVLGIWSLGGDNSKVVTLRGASLTPEQITRHEDDIKQRREAARNAKAKGTGANPGAPLLASQRSEFPTKLLHPGSESLSENPRVRNSAIQDFGTDGSTPAAEKSEALLTGKKLEVVSTHASVQVTKVSTEAIVALDRIPSSGSPHLPVEETRSLASTNHVENSPTRWIYIRLEAIVMRLGVDRRLTKSQVHQLVRALKRSCIKSVPGPNIEISELKMEFGKCQSWILVDSGIILDDNTNNGFQDAKTITVFLTCLTGDLGCLSSRSRERKFKMTLSLDTKDAALLSGLKIYRFRGGGKTAKSPQVSAFSGNVQQTYLTQSDPGESY